MSLFQKGVAGWVVETPHGPLSLRGSITKDIDIGREPLATCPPTSARLGGVVDTLQEPGVIVHLAGGNRIQDPEQLTSDRVDWAKKQKFRNSGSEDMDLVFYIVARLFVARYPCWAWLRTKPKGHHLFGGSLYFEAVGCLTYKSEGINWRMSKT